MSQDSHTLFFSARSKLIKEHSIIMKVNVVFYRPETISMTKAYFYSFGIAWLCPDS